MKIQSNSSYKKPVVDGLRKVGDPGAQPPSPNQPETKGDFYATCARETAANFAGIGALGGAAFSLWSGTGLTLEALKNIAIGGATGALGGALCGLGLAYMIGPYMSFPPER
ncbi:MAG: hypothetical protein U0931_29845 [Vulcanimicrobiota bacterium]